MKPLLKFGVEGRRKEEEEKQNNIKNNKRWACAQ
jgi:hypothetical protein